MLFRPLAELSLRIVLLSLSLGSVSKEDNAHFQIQQSAQVAIFRLRTGHNRLKYHLFNRLQLKYTDEIGKMMAKNVLEKCRKYAEEKIILAYAGFIYRQTL